MRPSAVESRQLRVGVGSRQFSLQLAVSVGSFSWQFSLQFSLQLALTLLANKF